MIFIRPLDLTGFDAQRRFWPRIARQLDGCWIWHGLRTKSPRRYGSLRILGHEHKVHRVAYTLLVGPIPEGMELDHLCRVKLCVNPTHLEPVTHWENGLRSDGLIARRARQITCIHGHPFDGHNGWQRTCSICRRATYERNYHRYYQRKT